MSNPDRRSFLARVVAAGMGGMSAAFAALAGVVAMPRRAPSSLRWRSAAPLTGLSADEPLTAVLAAKHDDGWYQTRKETVVFIDREGEGLRALSATCAHLGCRVKWDAARKQFLCPCHGGIYDRDGRVVAGPPPRGLDRLNVRVNPQTSEIEVEL